MAAYGRLLQLNKLKNFLSVRSNLPNSLQLFSSKSDKNFNRLKPKRPQSPFFAYFNNKKTELLEMYPNLKYMEVVRKAAGKWAELDPAEKDVYKKEYNDKFITYANELKSYEKYLLSLSEPERQHVASMQQKIQRDLKKAFQKEIFKKFGKPVKPKSGFFLYLDTRKGERESKTRIQNWIQSMASAWRSLPEERRNMYLSESNALYAQYKKDLAAWKEKMIEAGYKDIINQKQNVKSVQENE